MRYKIGDNVVGFEKEIYVITDINERHSNYYKVDGDNSMCLSGIRDRDIDHKATAKLTLPQPSRDMLRSGMKVVYRNGSEWFCLIELGRVYDSGFESEPLDLFKNDLTDCDEDRQYDIMQIWDEDTLIAQRTDKSEADLKKESLEKQMDELQQKVDDIAKEIKDL